MAVRRPRGSRTVAKAGPTVRVHAIRTLEQWENAVAKAHASKRLLVVQFYQTQNYACVQMRSYYRRMSTDGPLRAAVFTEIEVDEAEPALLTACGVAHGATRIPLYQCIAGREVVESYVGGVPAEVVKMIQRQLAELRRAHGGGMLPKLLLAAGAAAALAGALWWRFSSGGGGGDLGAELSRLGQRIQAVQQRLRNCERAGRSKQAKVQRGILQKLEAQQAQLEKATRQRTQPCATAQRWAGSDSEEEEEAPRPRRQAQQQRAAAAADSRTESANGDGRGSAPEVLYSDED